MGQWQRALVTGASSGIGEALVGLLAAARIDVVLVGRDVDALDRVATSARGEGVDALVLAADLATEAGIAQVVSVIRDSEPMIDLLVNNAGLGQFGSFVDLPIGGTLELMRVNNNALVALTHAALLRMVAADHGCVIQMSSTASASPGPELAVYAATKAFVSSFGQALSRELDGTGVTCTTVLPGYTRTRYFERIGYSPDIPDEYWMTADQVARVAFDGAREHLPLVIPGSIDQRAMMTATPFPSLTKRHAMRKINHVRHLASHVKQRLHK